MEVVDGGTVVIFFSVCKGLLGFVGEVRNVVLILVFRVVSFMCHWVFVLSMETAVVVGTVVEVLGVVVSIVVSVLDLVVSVMVIGIVVHLNMLWSVMMIVKRQIMMGIVIVVHVVMHVHAFNIVVIIVLFVMLYGRSRLGRDCNGSRHLIVVVCWMLIMRFFIEGWVLVIVHLGKCLSRKESGNRE